MNRSRLKRSLGIAALVVGALIVLAIAVVELVSWNFLKPRIAAQVASATGRELSIEGKVEVDLLPRPRITLHDVSLANPDWAGPDNFIHLDRLRAAPDVAALLTGRLALARIDIDAPVVRLIERDDGPGNWVMAGDTESDGQSDGEPVPVHRVHVENAEIHYRSADSDSALTLKAPAIRWRDDGESSSLAATLAVRDRRVDIEADADSLFAWDSPEPSFGGQLRLSAGESRVDTEFSLSKQAFPAEWQARLDARVADLDRWIALVPGIAPTGVGALSLQASLARSGTTWRAEQVDLRAMQSRLQADLAMDAAGEMPELSGSIRFGALDADVLGQAIPGRDATKSQPDAFAPPPIMPRLAGSLDVEFDRIEGLAVPIEGAEGRLSFGPHQLALEDIGLRAAGGSLQGSARIASGPESVSAAVALFAEGLRLRGGEQDGRTFDGDVDIRLEAFPREAWGRETILRHLKIDTAQVDYANPRKDTRLSASARLDGDDSRPVVTVSGTIGERPLEAKIEGGPLTAAWPGPAYALAGRAESASLALSVDTTLRSALAPARFEGRLSLAGDDVGDLGSWLGRDLVTTPPFRVSTRLDREGAQWNADEVRIELGATNLGGSVSANVEGRPHLTAALRGEVLDLGWLPAATGGRGGDGDAGDGAHGPESLRGFDAELELEVAEVRLPDAPTLGQLGLEARLEQGIVEVRRLDTSVAAGTLSLEGRLDAAETPASAQVDARFADIALSRLGETFTPLEERLGRLSGNLRVAATETLAEAYRDDVLAPMIGRVRIEPSELRFDDPDAGTEMRLSLVTEGLGEGEQRFRIDGSGRYDGDPFSMTYRSDALLDIRLPERPYAVDLDALIVDSRIELDGTLLRPLALEGLDLELALAGPNPQRLSRLLGIPLPELPAYEVSGELGLQQARWTLRDLDGTVGDSDLRGRLSLETDTSPPALTGELRSDSLDIDDLAGIAGAEPGTGTGKAPQEEQGTEAGQSDDRRFVLPAEPFIGDAWREVRADVRYRASAVRAGDVPLSDLLIEFRLTDGVARFAPVGFGVGEGSVDFTLNLDASRQPPEGTLSVEMRAVDLREALQDWDLADESVGIVAAQGKFWVTGESVADLLGSADGGLILLMSEGRLEALLVELAGLDASQAFLSWLRGRPAIPINCAYADLKARDGLVRLDTFVVDTTDTIFTAGGEVDFDDERLDISVLAHPQDASALIARTPFHFGGTFADIQTGVHGGEAALRIGASAGLAAVAGPLAALVPLLEAGVDDRTGYCQGLVQRTSDAIETEGDDDDEEGS